MISLPNILLATSLLLVVISAVQPLARRLVISDAVLLALVGILIGGGATFMLRSSSINAVDDAAKILVHFPINSQAFLFIFVPVLVFHGALSLDVRSLSRDAAPIFVLAVVAVLVTTAAVGAALFPFAHLQLIACLILGSLVATTDPSAVVGVFRDIGADSRLTRLVEGEALLNDAAAISIFTILLTAMLHHTAPTLLGAAWVFVASFAGGIALGYVLARLMLAAIPWLGGIGAAEMTLTLALPYVAYIVSDRYLHASGVVAAAAAGLTVSAIGPSTFRPRSWAFLQDVWRQMSFLASSLIFVLASMLVPRLLLGAHNQDLVLIAVVVVAALGARAAVLFGLLPALARLNLSRRVPIPFQVTILWGGLRGAITLALALAVTENAAIDEPVQRFVAIVATGYVMFTLLVNGTTLRFLVSWLQLDRLSPIDQALRNQVVAIGLGEVRDAIGQRGQEYGFSPHVVDHVLETYARRINEETAANTFDTAITDRDRVKLGLITFASQEKTLLLEMFKERSISRRVMESLLRTTESMIDGARADGRLGYIRAARRRLQPTAWFRTAQWLHRSFRINTPLMNCMMERFEMLLLMYLVYLSMMRFLKRRMEPVLGTRVAEIVAEIAERRREYLTEAMDTLRVQYPGYAEALESRMLRQIGLRLEADEFASLRQESLIGEELYEELVRSLEARRDRLARPLRFNLQTGLDHRIRQFPVFSELQPAVLHDLSMNFSMRFAVPGETIIRRGQFPHAIFFISSGTVEMQGEGEPVVLGPGDFFGEEEVLFGGVRRGRVRSLSFGQLLELSAGDFRNLIAEEPDLRVTLERVAAQRWGQVRPDFDALSPESQRLIEFEHGKVEMDAGRRDRVMK